MNFLPIPATDVAVILAALHSCARHTGGKFTFSGREFLAVASRLEALAEQAAADERMKNGKCLDLRVRGSGV